MPHLSARRTVVAALAIAALVSACDGPAPPRGPSRTSPGTALATPTTTVKPSTTVAPPTEPEASTSPQATPSDEGSVRPRITYAGPAPNGRGHEVSALVPELVEEGGTCTVTLRVAGRDAVIVPLTAVADAVSTSCGTAVLEPGALAPGSWEVTVAYDGPSGAGMSDPIVMEVRS